MRADDDVIDAKLFPVRLEAVVAFLGRAKDEPPLDQLFERAAEVGVVGHDFVLPPLGIVPVFRHR
jgi:hypothetical protein